MRVTVLVENTRCNTALGAQHGLSLLIETTSMKILFDLGSDDLFLKNAEQLGIDLGLVDLAILSHGHWDHGGGIEAFFQVNDHAPLYVRAGAFDPHYSLRDDGVHHWAGLDEALRDHRRIIFTEGETIVGDGLTLFGDVPDIHGLPRGNKTLFERIDGHYEVDRFSHEQYLFIEEGEQRALITGCSHRGIANIIEATKQRYKHVPTTVIGGFHLMDYTASDHVALDRVASQLLDSGAVYYTGHCTGEESYEYLKRMMGPALHYASGGMVLEIAEERKR